NDLPSGHNLIGTELANTGQYAFRHHGGSLDLADATRYVGTLAPGECKVQYWHLRYPQCMNEGSPLVWKDPPCTTATWGLSVAPDDDMALPLDIWATADGVTTASTTHTMTMRNEISAMANKIKPNPDGEWFNTAADTAAPGELITTNGILYELGLVRHGFDNDGDYRPDYNAWLQPAGDVGFDPSCFRLVRTHGTLTVNRGSGTPDLVIAFDDQQDPPSNPPQYGGPLYFTNLPDDNTGVRGMVYYTFLALDGPCATSVSPYQEVASGYDNEKFNGDYGTSLPALGSTEPKVTIDKGANPSTIPLGSTTTYQIPFANTGTAAAGLTMGSNGVDMPLVLRDTVPPGTEYQCGSSTYSLTYSPNTGVTRRYSINGGATWSTTEPCAAPNYLLSSGSTGSVVLEWWLNDPLPAGSLGNWAGFTVRVPDGSTTGVPAYSSSYVENCAEAGFDGAPPFAEACEPVLVEGSNSIGNYVWRDENRNGIQDDGAAMGIAGVTLRLYLDRGTAGVLDAADVLLATRETVGTADGNYLFDKVPDGSYLVVVDGDDSSIPPGYVATTPTVHAVPNLGQAGDTAYVLADFGFGPILTLTKGLTSGNPSYEGDRVYYEIDISNQRAGNGNPPGPCLYTTWGSSVTT
ncbi:MAG TPA: SdrD B-like domain-containing protein, partial [Anaerolineae bacterium]|nr:SdrD B-like domain-containing protein [Anaerolineae bacterium]